MTIQAEFSMAGMSSSHRSGGFNFMCMDFYREALQVRLSILGGVCACLIHIIAATLLFYVYSSLSVLSLSLNICTIYRFYPLESATYLLVLTSSKATVHRLLIYIRQQLVLVPHQIIIVAKVSTTYRRNVSLWRHLHGLGMRGLDSTTASDYPEWVGSQE